MKEHRNIIHKCHFKIILKKIFPEHLLYPMPWETVVSKMDMVLPLDLIIL